MPEIDANDPILTVVVVAWPGLPDHIRSAILTLVESTGVPNDANE
jgi:hypothetical protein